MCAYVNVCVFCLNACGPPSPCENILRGSCCVNSVQQGASDTESRRTDETKGDSAAEHR